MSLTDTAPLAILCTMEREVYQTDEGGGLVSITINRPEARNALNWAAQEQFARIINELQGQPELRVVIISSIGNDAFVSGGDLKEMSSLMNPAAGKRLTQIMGAALDSLTDLKVPVITAIDGDTVGGGCELLTACDLRIAAETARFRFAEVNMALTTGWGGTARLIQLIGLSRALDLLLTGRTFNADEAYRIGFINRLVPGDSDVLEAARTWARELVALPKEALAAAKELAWSASRKNREETRQLEVRLFRDLWLRPDHIEAVQAFMEKRDPEFNRE